MKLRKVLSVTATCWFAVSGVTLAANGGIVHDAEHYLLEAQHGKRWAQEDAQIFERLEELREANGGNPPNIV